VSSRYSYKQTEIELVPEDWEVVRLGEILDLIRNGLVLKQNKNTKGIPVTRIETIWEEKIDPKKVGYIDEISEREISEYKLREGDILFSHINSLNHIGKTAMYKGEPPLLLHGMNLLLLRPKKDCVEPLFLLYKLKHLRLKGLFKNMSKKAVNQASINQTELGRVKVILPPLPEQKKIAEILSTVDKAIEKVDQAIEKTERLKKGLMQELLTKGIGHTEFKDTEIGRIPKDWEVVRLRDVCNQRKEVTIPCGRGESKYVGLEHINSGELTLHTYGLDTEVKSSKFKFYEGDILYGKLRPYLDKAVLVNFKGICSTDLLVLTPIKSKTLAEFLIWIVHSNKFKWHAISTTSGTNHPRTSWKAMSKFRFGLPPLPEQKKIAEILSTVDKRLELLRKRKEKLERIKRGLMNDLLTGRKRVKLGEQGE